MFKRKKPLDMSHIVKTPVVSTSELMCKKILDTYFGPFRKVDNIRPPWLNGMELDRYYPELGVAIEFQGIQHYRPTKVFQKTRKQFFNQLKRDTEKNHLAQKHGVRIFQIGLSDITQNSYMKTVREIANYAARYAQLKRDSQTFQKLMSINWQRRVDPQIFRKLESIKRSKKWHVPKKKSNLLKSFFHF